MSHTRVTVEVEVHKEPTNQADPWLPPTAREVAFFLQELASDAETDDGWYVGIVAAAPGVWIDAIWMALGRPLEDLAPYLEEHGASAVIEELLRSITFYTTEVNRLTDEVIALTTDSA